MTEPALSTEKICKRYKEFYLKDIDLLVSNGEVLGLIGTNGSGKTTFINLILGLSTMDSGSIKIFGSNDLITSRKRINAVLESGGFFKEFSAQKNLEILCDYYSINYDGLGFLLKKLNLPSNKKIMEFSRGMLQRLNIAKSLLVDKDLYIFDEPVSSLDAEGILLFREIIYDLKANNKTIIIASHNLSELELLCSHIVLLKDGEIVLHEKSSEIIKQFGAFEHVYRE